MKKYLFIILCACVAMYVAADDSLRSQVHKPQASTIINSQDDKQEGISEAYVAASHNSVEKDQAAEKTIPDIKGGGLVPRPVRPGNQGGKSAGGIHTTELVSDAKFDVLHSEAAVESNAYSMTGSSDAPSQIQAVDSDIVPVDPSNLIQPKGGSLVPRPCRPGGGYVPRPESFGKDGGKSIDSNKTPDVISKAGTQRCKTAAKSKALSRFRAVDPKLKNVHLHLGGSHMNRTNSHGHGGGKTVDAIKTTEVISEVGMQRCETAVESNANSMTGLSYAPSQLQAVSSDKVIVGGGNLSVILGGGLVPRPPYNPSWGNANVVAYVSSRDGHSVLPPFIVPQDGILYTNSTGFVMQSSGKLLEPLGGGLVPRWPPRSGSIIPGAVVLSRGNGSGSGSLRSNAAPIMLGDVNHDGKVDVSDITSLNEYVLGNPLEVFVTEVADVNADGIIDVGDVTELTHFVLNGTWEAE